VGQAHYKGKDVTAGRSPHRPLLPDTVGPEQQKPTALRGRAHKAKADKRHRRCHVGECLPEGWALHRGSEYNRRTGCGKTARPGLYGGCRVTGIPTVEAPQNIMREEGKM
jgi:hypothetical protein